MTEQKRITKKTVFCRRNKDRGIYTGNVGNNVIRLVDRDVYSPKGPEEAKFLMDDPEIEIFCTNEDEQKRENERKDVQDKVTTASGKK